MNQADWTPSPSGELDALMRRRRLVRHDAVALSLGGLGIVAATVVWIWAAVALFANGFVVAGAVLAIFVADFTVAHYVDRRREALRREVEAIDGALKEEFGGAEGWLVELIVLRGAAPVGTDRGMMWVEGDRLYFSGHRTSFALTPDGVDGPMRAGMPIRGIRGDVTIPLAIETSAGQGAISIRALRSRDPALFEASMREWSKAPTKGGGQFPPTAVGPGAAVRGRVLAGAVASTAYWVGVAALAIWAGYGTQALMVALTAALLATILHAWTPQARWRAWQDLGRVPPPTGLPSPRGLGE